MSHRVVAACAASIALALGVVLGGAGLDRASPAPDRMPVPAPAHRSSAVDPGPSSSPGARIRAMSFNILTAENHAEDRPWAVRRSTVAHTVVSEGVDVLGAQEASVTRDWEGNDDGVPQWESLRRVLAPQGYDRALTGSDGRFEDCGRRRCSADEEAQFGVHIYYNTATLEPVGSGGTVNVDNDWCEWDDRAMVWQVFRTRATPSTAFVAVNTHLYYEGIEERGDLEKCRTGQVKNILKALRTSVKPVGLPVVLMGDLNSYAHQDPVRTLIENGFVDTVEADAPRRNTTFNSFHGFRNPPPRVPGKRIDYIMVSGGIDVRRWELVARTNPRTGRFVGEIPSDHHPILAVLTLPPPPPAVTPWRCLSARPFPLRWTCFQPALPAVLPAARHRPGGTAR
ncbi:hypothetical protein NCCP1664_04340 [Zafaria cholistanensis]|uniref:Endonuclease/exonuclease/phosphatase domain-containing protein n=1 Tax=Zafaria cholistanensis TaxID=1682741 RepID=A0A5A7NPK9_9MICC|nr:endonuclease/exonuclease/phosphatase family protein [Zafaria cholistanensis]GER21937.1 hypothetical protein NCCP1664_04340 [Zafaria cholistanensis]